MEDDLLDGDSEISFAVDCKWGSCSTRKVRFPFNNIWSAYDLHCRTTVVSRASEMLCSCIQPTPFPPGYFGKLRRNLEYEEHIKSLRQDQPRPYEVHCPMGEIQKEKKVQSSATTLKSLNPSAMMGKGRKHSSLRFYL